MKAMNLKWTWGLVIFTNSIGLAHADVTKIGNGDDGGDLEGFTELTSGPIVKARKAALKLVQSMNVSGVPGLGALVPEIENSKLYLTKEDTAAKIDSDQGSFHVDMKGQVFARTFAEPHAATRFFPAATHLDADQLVALHIHEGLHRSLPESAREDESIVSSITLAITAPGANYDHLKATVAKLIPETVAPPAVSESGQPAEPLPENSRAKYPSVFGYDFRKFKDPTQPTAFKVNSMHIVRTELYPFSLGDDPVGLGMEFSLINRPTSTLMGPLKLSAQTRIWSKRGFDVGLFANLGLNMLSNEELKKSQYGRDTTQVGISLRKDLTHFSIENYLSYLFPGESLQKIGNIDYHYQYGGVVEASTHPALLFGGFRIGGFFEVTLGDYYRVNGGAFTYDPGRYRLVSGGPEVQYRYENISVGLAARYLINATQDASYDSLGDLMGPGVAQGNVTASLSVYF